MFYRDALVRFRRAGLFIKCFNHIIVAILGLAFAVAGLNALEPLILKYLFDRIEGDLNARALVVGLSALGGIALVREAAAALTNWLTWRTRLKIHYRILEASVGRLQKLPISYHRNETVGAIMTRLDRGIQGFLGAVSEIAFNALPAFIYLGIALSIMTRLNVPLTLIVLVFAPCPVLVTMLATPENIRRERTLLEMWTRIYSRFNEVLSGIVTVKSFAMEDAEKQRFLRGVEAAN
jgi:ATP-binding cassette subfamily B protein